MISGLFHSDLIIIQDNDKCPCGSGNLYSVCHSKLHDQWLKGTLPSPKASDPYPEYTKEEMSSTLVKISKELDEGIRLFPSKNNIIVSNSLMKNNCLTILNTIASVVDTYKLGGISLGRSDQCLQFAFLLRDVLTYLSQESKVVYGLATYKTNLGEFTWEHSWIVTKKDLIDGNVDSMIENPAVPPSFKLYPPVFWGEFGYEFQDRTYTPSAYVGDSFIERDPDYSSWKEEIFKNKKIIKLINH